MGWTSLRLDPQCNVARLNHLKKRGNKHVVGVGWVDPPRHLRALVAPINIDTYLTLLLLNAGLALITPLHINAPPECCCRRGLPVQASKRRHLRGRVCVCVCACGCVCVWVYVCMGVHVCMGVCMGVCIDVCVCAWGVGVDGGLSRAFCWIIAARQAAES
jgi:hypothetical protein